MERLKLEFESTSPGPLKREAPEQRRLQLCVDVSYEWLAYKHLMHSMHRASDRLIVE